MGLKFLPHIRSRKTAVLLSGAFTIGKSLLRFQTYIG